MNERFKLVVTTQRLNICNANDRRTDPPVKDMATLDIPSLPSSDLNRMISFILPRNNHAWGKMGVTQTIEDNNEAEDSPEPKTPKFGESTTPSFAESNAQFGFRFLSPNTKPWFFREANKPDSTSNSTISSEHETAVGGGEHFLLQNENIDSIKQLNIPTTVMEKVEESPKRASPELPTIRLSNGDGKPDSYIKFLNVPIPIDSVQYEHQEVNIEKYRTENSAEVEKPGLVSDIEAIQKMEEEPSFQTINLAQIGSDQCVPSSGAVQYYEVSSNDSSSVQMYQQDHDVVVEDVAAYQSVADTPTYAELKPRQAFIADDHVASLVADTHGDAYVPDTQGDAYVADTHDDAYVTVRQSETVTRTPVSVHEQDHHRVTIEGAVENFSVASVLKTVPEKEKSLVLKNGLKNKIQLKRLQEGKEPLKVSFESKPIGEPSEEEKIKALSRKMKNRESAVRSRQRRQNLMQQLEKEVKELERENKSLMKDINRLKSENSELATYKCSCGHTQASTESGHVMFPAEISKLESKESRQTLQEAIICLLAAEDKT